MVDSRPAPGQGVRHENAAEEREACGRGREVLECLPHHVKVLVRRRVGLPEVESRGEGCAEHAEAVHDGERTDGEVSEAGLGHLSIYKRQRAATARLQTVPELLPSDFAGKL